MARIANLYVIFLFNFYFYLCGVNRPFFIFIFYTYGHSQCKHATVTSFSTCYDASYFSWNFINCGRKKDNVGSHKKILCMTLFWTGDSDSSSSSSYTDDEFISQWITRLKRKNRQFIILCFNPAIVIAMQHIDHLQTLIEEDAENRSLRSLARVEKYRTIPILPPPMSSHPINSGSWVDQECMSTRTNSLPRLFSTSSTTANKIGILLGIHNIIFTIFNAST